MRSGLMVLAARVALVTLVMQVTAVGHWNFGPFHSDNGPDAFASHAAHCHSDTSGCAGESSFTGTYLEQPIEAPLPYATIELPVEPAASPQAVTPAAPERPPRAA
jgi:hypothetical protein